MAQINKKSKSWLNGQGWTTRDERVAKRALQEQDRKDTIFGNAPKVPDDEQLKRTERRKAAKRQGSRANTVLTNNDQLG